MKYKNFITLLIVSLVILVCNNNILLNASLSPLIYTETDSFNYLKEAGPIIWYVIDDDPKEYWITIKNNDTEEYLETPQKFSNSKIIFTPSGLSTGRYNISLYVSDYSGYTVSSTVEFTIIREIYTFTATGTTTETNAAASSISLGILVFIFGILGIFKLKNRYKLKK
ncbi:MAG: hypothetical protein HeimC3_53950 [Candidatus Heimdallarchaeota archaeon LC_3]|nr:MAG: hypothetical protein HeimC3_53950 [Candidatus Heimdallarchaeota archaeon LC_3]